MAKPKQPKKIKITDVVYFYKMTVEDRWSHEILSVGMFASAGIDILNSPEYNAIFPKENYKDINCEKFRLDETLIVMPEIINLKNPLDNATSNM